MQQKDMYQELTEAIDREVPPSETVDNRYRRWLCKNILMAEAEARIAETRLIGLLEGRQYGAGGDLAGLEGVTTSAAEEASINFSVLAKPDGLGPDIDFYARIYSLENKDLFALAQDLVALRDESAW